MKTESVLLDKSFDERLKSINQKHLIFTHLFILRCDEWDPNDRLSKMTEISVMWWTLIIEYDLFYFRKSIELSMNETTLLFDFVSCLIAHFNWNLFVNRCCRFFKGISSQSNCFGFQITGSVKRRLERNRERKSASVSSKIEQFSSFEFCKF